MNADTEAVPRDYRLLVPREWFRVDLTREGWRPQLKTFVDLHTADRNVPAEVKQDLWSSLRNAAEAGLAHGALEFFLLSETDDGRALPASLLVSLLPAAGAEPDDLARSLARRRGDAADVGVVALPAGPAVRDLRTTALDLHVRMPGGVGYLALSFSAPVSGMSGPMAALCDAIARSLRWTA